MRKSFLFLTLLILCASPVRAELTTHSKVTLSGIGPVRAGMSVAQAAQAAGQRLVRDRDDAGDSGCHFVYPEHGPDGVGFMVQKGRIVRVDIGQEARIATVQGIHIGDTEARIRALYPGQITAERHPYGSLTDHYLVLTPKDFVDKKYLLIFETTALRVSSFRSGLKEAVQLIEGCS